MTQDPEAPTAELKFIMSPQIDKVAAALAKAQGAFPAGAEAASTGHVGRDDHSGRDYQYADLESVIKAVRAPLAENELALVGLPSVAKSAAHAGLTLLLMHSSGQFLGAYYEMPAGENTAQKHGSALTYNRRYLTMALLNIGTNDDDGRLASEKASPDGRGQRRSSSPPREDSRPPVSGFDPDERSSSAPARRNDRKVTAGGLTQDELNAFWVKARKDLHLDQDDMNYLSGGQFLTWPLGQLNELLARVERMAAPAGVGKLSKAAKAELLAMVVDSYSTPPEAGE